MIIKEFMILWEGNFIIKDKLFMEGSKETEALEDKQNNQRDP